MEKKNRPQGTTSKNRPFTEIGGLHRWIEISHDNDMKILCGFPHYHKYIMPAGIGKNGCEFSIMLTDKNDKPIVFLRKDGNGNLSVKAEIGTDYFNLLLDFDNVEKEFKEYTQFKEY